MLVNSEISLTFAIFVLIDARIKLCPRNNRTLHLVIYDYLEYFSLTSTTDAATNDPNEKNNKNNVGS